jgi:hypothetical protein
MLKKEAKKNRKRKAKMIKQYLRKNKPRKAIKKVASKKAIENAMYRVVRAAYLADKPLCEVCRNEAHDVHHKKGRIGALLTDAAYFLAVCRPCHDKIHANPLWAYEKGYLISSSKTTPDE